MELLQYFNIIRRWIWLIVLATALAGGSSLIASKLTTPVYRTTTTLMVSQITSDPNPNTGDIYASQQLAQTYVQLVTREPILNASVTALGLKMNWETLRRNVSAVPITGTQLIEISVIDTSPARAMAIANELARQLILQSPSTPSQEEQKRLTFIQIQLPDLEDKISRGREQIAQLDQTIASASSARVVQEAQTQQSILNGQIAQWQSTYAQLLGTLKEGNLNYLSVVETASMPNVNNPISPKTGLNVLVASAIGLALSLGGAFLLEYLDDTIRTAEEARALVKAPILTAIGQIPGDSYPAKLVAYTEPRSPTTEAYRELRTNLQFSSLDKKIRVIVLTSPGPSEGKSLTASNLAVVLAQAGLRVVLVDADLRKPVLHKIFEVKNRAGLTTWLVAAEQARLMFLDPTMAQDETAVVEVPETMSFIQQTKVPRLQLVPCGPIPPNPAEVLGSERMQEFVQEMLKISDVVILDSPPCVTVTDSAVLSRFADGVLLVLDGQNTNRLEARRARENLDAVGAKVLGLVLNRIDPTRGRYSSYAYSSAYSSYYYNAADEEPKDKQERSSALGGSFSVRW